MKTLGAIIAFGAACLAWAVPAGAVEPTKIDWYGYFKLDLARDSGVSSNGNFILYVKPGSSATLNLTADGVGYLFKHLNIAISNGVTPRLNTSTVIVED